MTLKYNMLIVENWENQGLHKKINIADKPNSWIHCLCISDIFVFSLFCYLSIYLIYISIYVYIYIYILNCYYFSEI